MKICQVCYKPNLLHKHHITSKSCGGSNKPHNIAHICPNCHNLVHNSIIVLEGIFLTSEGYELLWHYKDGGSITGIEPPKVFTY